MGMGCHTWRQAKGAGLGLKCSQNLTSSLSFPTPQGLPQAAEEQGATGGEDGSGATTQEQLLTWQGPEAVSMPGTW